MGKTKKVGISGRFGARYGSKLRKQWRDITSKQKGITKCPKCNTKLPNMREFVGVWHCKKCGATWTGGSWESATARGKESHRIAIRMAREASEAEQNPASTIKK
ncbi:50S ribosomal protein L37ae [Promethearchaeum syntrophicum]|uniref:Large ribosomal subunit protein eL43 n=1 Tax=Promethearchaeum syntrophicum TaxID=2594042 RepID=A0A5B9D6W6_9ARCH|nr:50S ribosomal protein L37ae [Candidatus Prometheoarchaeum syntrophicum]QEE14723.1 50S ribosomal protein L37Ae [Candidatus Prometheoarchaeum syntrophicum]